MRFILIAAFLFTPFLAQANEIIPIPKKRPKILSVSPAYIEELINRDRVPVRKPSAELFIDTTNIEEELEQIKPEAGNAAKEVKASYVPIPRHKPVFETPEIPEQRLVSFLLPPKEIRLDKNLKSFLTNHALDIFRNNQNTRLDIQAYASSEDQSQNSSARIALARALEVRKFLLANNIEPNRITLSPLAGKKEYKNSDRIDLVFIEAKSENF